MALHIEDYAMVDDTHTAALTSARPKLWITLAVDAPVSGWRSLCANCRYDTVEPSRFFRRVSRKYIPTRNHALAGPVRDCCTDR